MRDLIDGRVDLADLETRLPGGELEAWLGEARERAARLCQVGELQARLVTARFRPALVSRLLEITSRPDANAETVRKACVDVLKLDARRAPASAASAKARDLAARLERQVVGDAPGAEGGDA